MPRLRATPDDFVVDEIPLYPATGEGTHTFVRIEKRGRTTEQVARALARAIGVDPRDVGYAGRKDRDAVTTQFFSLPGVAPETALALELEGVRVLEALRHPHRLRTGQLLGNRFEIVVRDVDDEIEAAAAEAAFASLVERGMPNRFGDQRFGRDGDNAARAIPLLHGEAFRGDRRELRFLISALQSAVFNAVLERRPLPLDRLELGDVAMIHASGGSFLVEDLDREQPRADAFEISPTGPMFGSRLLATAGAPAAREADAMAACGLDPGRPIVAPRGIRLRGARRPLRVPISEPSFTREPGAVRLRFVLPAGSFASVLCECLFPTLRQPSIL